MGVKNSKIAKLNDENDKKESSEILCLLDYNFISGDGATSFIKFKTEFCYENVPNYNMYGFHKKDNNINSIIC